MTTKRRWRSRLRVVRRVLVVVLLLLVLAAGAVTIALHTDWGRAKLRDEIVARLNNTLSGGIDIGTLEGSALGDLVLRNVVIRDREGRTANAIDRLESAVKPLALLD